ANDVYLRLNGAPIRLRDGHVQLFAAAAEAMRRILVADARRKFRKKRGGGLRRVDLGGTSTPDAEDRLLALHDALSQLAAQDNVAPKVVELRRYAGLRHEQVAADLGITAD